MRVVVVSGPKPILTPADLPGKHEGDDAHLTALIAAAQAGIDGPTGWLGRALGEQTLDVFGWWCEGPIVLPYGPAIEVEGVFAASEDGTESEIDGATYRLRNGSVVFGESAIGAPWWRLPQHRIRYRAGYDGTVTGAVPANAKAAVMLLTRELQQTGSENGGLRSFSVDGAFEEAYNSPEQVQRSRNVTVENLLAPLRVYA